MPVISDKFDALLESIGGNESDVLEEGSSPKQLAANIEAFHRMIRSHMKDLNTATAHMKRLEPALKAAMQRGDKDVISDAVDLMMEVNKDLNSCHLPLDSVAQDLHKAIAVDLPDWKRKK